METNTNTTELPQSAEDRKKNGTYDHQYRVHIAWCDACRGYEDMGLRCEEGNRLHVAMMTDFRCRRRGEIFREIEHDRAFRAANNPPKVMMEFHPTKYPDPKFWEESGKAWKEKMEHFYRDLGRDKEKPMSKTFKRTFLIILGIVLILAALWGGVYFAHICQPWAEFPTVASSLMVAFLGFVSIVGGFGAFEPCDPIPEPKRQSDAMPSRDSEGEIA